MDKSALYQPFSFGPQLSPTMSSGLRIARVAVLGWFGSAFAHRLIRGFRLYVSRNFENDQEVERIATLGRVFRYIALITISLIAREMVNRAGGRLGVTEELSRHYLRLRDYSGKVHFVPNAISTVANMTRGAAYAVADVTVAHGKT